MSAKENMITDISAELAKEFGEIGSSKRENVLAQAWKEYNEQILLDAHEKHKTGSKSN